MASSTIILGTPRSGTTAIGCIVAESCGQFLFTEPTNLGLLGRFKLANESLWMREARQKIAEAHDKHFGDDFNFVDHIINIITQIETPHRSQAAQHHTPQKQKETQPYRRLPEFVDLASRAGFVVNMKPWWGMESNLFIVSSTEKKLNSATSDSGIDHDPLGSKARWWHQGIQFRVERYNKLRDKHIKLETPEFWSINGIAQTEELIAHKKIKKILLPYRKNVFKQALSFCISRKLQEWHGDCDFVRNSIVGKLDEEMFKAMLLRFYNHNKFVESLPNSNKYKLCKYEDFFEIKSKQETSWKNMFKFLDCEYTPDISAYIARYLGHKKYNGPETYSKIENLENLKNIYSNFMLLFGHPEHKKIF